MTGRSTLAEGPEIVIGLVGAVGTDLQGVEERLSQELRRVGYTPTTIRLSSLISKFPKFSNTSLTNGSSEDERIEALMTAGD